MIGKIYEKSLYFCCDKLNEFASTVGYESYWFIEQKSEKRAKENL